MGNDLNAEKFELKFTYLKISELNQIMNKNPAKIFEAIKKSDEAKEILTKKPDPNAFIPRFLRLSISPYQCNFHQSEIAIT